MLAQARCSQTVSKRVVFPGLLSLGEYPGGTTFLSPWAGVWGEPGADLQQASLTVVVGSCGPNRPEMHLVKIPLFTSAACCLSPLCCVFGILLLPS